MKKKKRFPVNEQTKIFIRPFTAVPKTRGRPKSMLMKALEQLPAGCYFEYRLPDNRKQLAFRVKVSRISSQLGIKIKVRHLEGRIYGLYRVR